ncbi:MAG: methyltransferase domain-containing protein [Patescibacteria group bacterium]
MPIFQPDRFLIKQQMARIGHYITGRVLDVGAGKYNRYKGYFKSSEYITLDYDPKNKPDIVASADKIPLPDKDIDSIVCTGMMGDLPDLQKAILEFHRVLKSTGKILITEYFITPMHDEPIDFWRFTPFGLEELFIKNGFRKLFLERRGGFFTAIVQITIRYLIEKFNFNSKKWAKIFNPIFRLSFRLAFFLDRIDKSQANSRCSIGWTAIFEKT